MLQFILNFPSTKYLNEDLNKIFEMKIIIILYSSEVANSEMRSDAVSRLQFSESQQSKHLELRFCPRHRLISGFSPRKLPAIWLAHTSGALHPRSRRSKLPWSSRCSVTKQLCSLLIHSMEVPFWTQIEATSSGVWYTMLVSFPIAISVLLNNFWQVNF